MAGLLLSSTRETLRPPPKQRPLLQKLDEARFPLSTSAARSLPLLRRPEKPKRANSAMHEYTYYYHTSIIQDKSCQPLSQSKALSGRQRTKLVTKNLEKIPGRGRGGVCESCTPNSWSLSFLDPSAREIGGRIGHGTKTYEKLPGRGWMGRWMGVVDARLAPRCFLYSLIHLRTHKTRKGRDRNFMNCCDSTRTQLSTVVVVVVVVVVVALL